MTNTGCTISQKGKRIVVESEKYNNDELYHDTYKSIKECSRCNQKDHLDFMYMGLCEHCYDDLYKTI